MKVKILISFIMIVRNVIIPVFIVMTIGFILQKRLELSIQTLARLNIYYVVPAFIFIRLYETTIPWDMFAKVVFFTFILVILLYTLTMIIGTLLGFNKRKKVTLTNSVIFSNSGNYAIPVNDLVFHSNPFAM